MVLKKGVPEAVAEVEVGGDPNAAEGGKGCEGNCTVVVTMVELPEGVMEIFVVEFNFDFLATGDDMPKPVFAYGGRAGPPKCHSMS